jgi:hypothetical protein
MASASLKQLASLRMDNKTHLLVFAFIAIPGSPYLVLSGIPLLGKLEAALFCFVAIAIATQWMRTRQTIVVAPASTRSQASKTILIVLISAKLISLFAFPLQSGFEACYKSLYNPESGCEKSYNNPFFRNDDVNQIGDISRVDKHINFRSTNSNKIAKTGTNSSNWNLPFANEYPRLADLWLTRIPFEVQFAGVIDSDSDGFLPIEFTGDINVETSNFTYNGESYTELSRFVIPIKAGRTAVKIKYRYTDNENTAIPQSEPKPRGPYAHLVLGKVVQGKTHIEQELNVSGWVVDSKTKRDVASVVLQNTNGEIVASSSKTVRTDVNEALLIPNEFLPGYQFQLLLDGDTESEQFEVVAILQNGDQETISDVYVTRNGAMFKEPVIKDRPLNRLVSSTDFVDASLSQSIELSTAKRTVPPSLLSRMFFDLLDITQLAIGLLLLLVATISNSQRLRRGLIFGSVSIGWLLAISLVARLTQTELHLLQVVGVVLYAGFYFYRNVNGLFLGLFISCNALFFGKLLQILREQHGLGDANWWGFQIFRTRDSDWFVYQGYARQIFKAESLQGGENTFYFMPGMRYLVFISHILFGENDVLIALIGGIGLPLTLIALVLLLGRSISAKHRPIGLVMLAALSVYLSNSTIIDLSMYTAAEIPAWLLIVLGCLMVFHRDRTPWKQFLGLAVLGLSANLRPNYSVMIFWLFLVAIFVTVSELKPLLVCLTRVTRMVLAFSLTFFLSFFHNLWYGLERTLFTNIADPNQTDFPPRELLHFFGNPEMRTLVVNKIGQALQWDQADKNFGLFVVVLAVQLCWLVGFGNLLIFGKNRAIAALFATTPFVLLASYMPFSYTWIPIRHFFMLFLTLIISYLVAAGFQRPQGEPKPTGYNEDGLVPSGQVIEGS